MLTLLVVSGATRSVDVAVADAVQGFHWGPLRSVMRATSAIGEPGAVQAIVGGAVVIALLLVSRRAGYLVILGALASVINLGIRLLIPRDGPHASVSAVLDPAHRHSFPSGHAVLFTWVSFLVAAGVSPRLPPWLRHVVWGLAAAVTAVACAGRVWIGAHWPSDVLGGLLLGLGWSAFVLWLPQRWVR
ncbi:MAG: phosphatase PAP2 family protein [Candidatus Dormibacteraeota bacterium]|nr:phosphatase PAP2 family protein [Candidatus Dormibacteraeota bacterium]